MKNFFQKNYVFIAGLLGSIGLVLQQFIGEQEISLKVVGFAVLMSVLSFLANQWRGKGVTITGIIGTLSFAFISVQNTGHFTWSQFVLAAVLALLSAVAPPPKPDSYEKK
jgi:hypothetical protein